MCPNTFLPLHRIFFMLGFFFLLPFLGLSQNRSIVVVHGSDGLSGYGVVYSAPDRVVTALHVVAGKNPISVNAGGQSVEATIEKIYKESDLALLKLKGALPVTTMNLYSGNIPLNTNVKFWKFDRNAPWAREGNTALESQTSLSKINANVKPDPGLENSLCKDGGKPYPGMTTEVIKFENPNIDKNYSGSPLTYQDKIVGLVDGGTKLTDGKPLVWAIHYKDILTLLKSGTPPPAGMSTCANGASAKSMYSGVRSDNPYLTEEQKQTALLFEEAASKPLVIHDNSGDTLSIRKYQRMPFSELYETLFDEKKQRINDLFSDEISFAERDRLSPEDLMDVYMDMDLGQQTGAWIVYPSGSEFVASKNTLGTVISINDASGLSSFSFYLSKNKTPEEANMEMIKFKEMLQGLGQKTEATPNNIKDYNCETANPYYRELIQNPDYDEQTDALLSDFTASITINKSDFLGAWLSVSDWKKMWKDRESRKMYYLLQSAVLFADFAVY